MAKFVPPAVECPVCGFKMTSQCAESAELRRLNVVYSCSKCSKADSDMEELPLSSRMDVPLPVPPRTLGAPNCVNHVQAFRAGYQVGALLEQLRLGHHVQATVWQTVADYLAEAAKLCGRTVDFVVAPFGITMTTTDTGQYGETIDLTTCEACGKRMPVNDALTGGEDGDSHLCRGCAAEETEAADTEKQP